MRDIDLVDARDKVRAQRLHIRRIVAAADLTFKADAGFNAQQFVEDFAVDPRPILQDDTVRTDRTFDLAADHHLIGSHVSGDDAFVADQQEGATNIAFNPALDLQFSPAFEITGDQQPTVYNRTVPRTGSPGGSGGLICRPWDWYGMRFA